jgi:hypothetical protein
MCLFEILQPAIPSRTQALKSTRICSLSPLSHGARGLTDVFVRNSATCNSESNSGFEKHKDLLPFPLSPVGRGLG